MTHDELLAEIDNLNDSCSVADRLAISLRAVVELHKPMQVATGGSWTQDNFTQTFELRCPQCSRGYNQLYPCPTIQAIEKELG